MSQGIIDPTSFDQILNRTRNNIQRISKKYSSDNVNPLSSPTLTGRSPIRTPATYRKYGLNLDGSATKAEPYNENSNINAGTGDNGVGINNNTTLIPGVEANLDEFKGGLLARMSRLERVHAEVSTDGDSTVANMVRKISQLENTVDEMKGKLDTQAGDMKEMQRLISQNSNTLLRQNGQVNALLLENDNRVALFGKLDGWVRQGEGWRSGLDRDMEELKSRQTLLEKSHKATTETTNEYVSKFELEAMKDRVTLICNQAVSHGIAMWHEKVETQLRTVERQMASLRSGGVIPVEGTISSDPQIKEALTSQQPSELMIHSVVSKQISELQQSMEDSISSHVLASMKAQLHDALQENKKNMPMMVARAIEDQEGSSKGTSTVIPKGLERQVHSLEDSLATLNVAMQSLRDENERGQKDRKAELRIQERKVEEAITISKTSVNTIQDRAKNLEDRMHELMKDRLNWRDELRNELNERVNAHKDEFGADWNKVDTRILMLEKITESLNEKMSVSKDLVEAYFLGSPEIKALQSTAIKVDGINAEVKALRVETKESIGLTNRLDASTVKLSDFSELREKINQMHLINERLDLQGQSVERLDSQLEDVRKSEVKLSTAISAASDKMDECLKMTSTARDENDVLKKDLETISKQCKDLGTKLDTKTAPLTRIESDVLSIRTDLDTINNTLTQIPKLTASITGLEENFNSLNEHVDVANAEINELQNDLRDVKTEVVDVKSDIGDVRSLVAASSGSIKEEDLQKALQQNQRQTKAVDLKPLENRVTTLEREKKIDIEDLLKRMDAIERTASSISSSSSLRPSPLLTNAKSSHGVSPSHTDSVDGKETTPATVSNKEIQPPSPPEEKDGDSSMAEKEFAPSYESEDGGNVNEFVHASSVLSEIESAIETPALTNSASSAPTTASTLALTYAPAEEKSLPSKKKGKGSSADKKSGGRVTTPIDPQNEGQPAVAAPKSMEKEEKLSTAMKKKSGGRVTTPVEEQTKNTSVAPPSPSGSDGTSNWDDMDVDMAPNSDTESYTTAGSFAGASNRTTAAIASSTPAADISGMSIKERLKQRQKTMKEKTGNTPVKKSSARHTSDEIMDFDA